MRFIPFILLLIAGQLSSLDAYACSCATDDVKVLFDHSPIVFVAKVNSVSPEVVESNGHRTTRGKFQVISVMKGTPA